jgi:hypothetical protein
MVKFKVFILIIVILQGFSCQTTYKIPRVQINRFRLKPNVDKQVYKIIDTAAIYIYDSSNNGITKDSTTLLQKIGVKFYGNGRIAELRNINIENKESFNPKMAIMGIYNLSNMRLFAEFARNTPQAGVFISRDTILVKENEIILKDGPHQYKYIKHKIPAQFLVFAPNW